MSYADLPSGACYVPELHLETFWIVKYDGYVLLMDAEEFIDFADRVKYDEIEYEAKPEQRTREWYNSLMEARI